MHYAKNSINHKYFSRFISKIAFFLRITRYNVDVHNTHAHSPLRTHIRKPHPYEHTTGVSLSTGTSPTTESIVPLNSKINPEKYEHMYQVDDLNPGG